MVLQDLHCNMENYRATSKNCTTQALNSDVYPISQKLQIPQKTDIQLPSGVGKKVEWELVGDAAIILFFFFFTVF